MFPRMSTSIALLTSLSFVCSAHAFQITQQGRDGTTLTAGGWCANGARFEARKDANAAHWFVSAKKSVGGYEDIRDLGSAIRAACQE